MLDDVPPCEPEVTFVGTGEAADPDLPNASLLYRGGRTLLLDCGYSVPQAFWHNSRNPNLIDAVYLTHLHADHTFGLPGLLLWMRDAGREKPLHILGGPGLCAWLKNLLDIAYPGFREHPAGFDLVFEELSPDKPHALGPLTLRTAQSSHPAMNLAIRIEERDRATCYSGDGAPTDETRLLYRGAHLLAHECYRGATKSSGHADAGEVLSMARAASVRCLCLIHFKVSCKEDIAQLAGSGERNSRLRVRIPVPGETVRVET